MYKARIHVIIYDLYNLSIIIDVYLQLLINELNQLHSDEEFTYDISRSLHLIIYDLYNLGMILIYKLE